MKPPARAIVGNLVWSVDGGVWGVWQVSPFPHAHTAPADKLAVHSRLRGLLISLPPAAMLLSVCERLDPVGVVTDMAAGVDIETQDTWVDVCAATGDWLSEAALYKRRYYVAAELPSARRPWLELLRGAAGEVNGAFGIGPSPVKGDELEARRRQAREIETRLASNVSVTPAGAGRSAGSTPARCGARPASLRSTRCGSRRAQGRGRDPGGCWPSSPTPS